MKRLTEYSEDLGLCKAYLGVYRINRGFPKKSNPLMIYEAYKAELSLQGQTRVKMQELYYKLREKRGDIAHFARYLVAKGIIISENSFRSLLGHSFRNLDGRLIGCQHENRHIEILKAYEEWR